MDVRCANCGAKIRLERDDALVTCSYCGSTLYLDRGHTFLQFLLPPSVSPAQARDLLAQDLAEREVGAVSVRDVKGFLLPFWGVRGEALQESIPAFSPVPTELAGYHLPAAGATVFDGKAPEGFTAVPCGEVSSASWEGRADVASFGLYMVPFYRISYSAGSTAYTAGVEAVSGRVYLARTPPSLTSAITHRFWTVLALLFALFTVEGLLVPGLLPSAVAIAVTGALFFPAVRQALREGTA
jgi:hypothetical protein